jgi:hypothetical protein
MIGFYLECGHSVTAIPSPDVAPETGLWTIQKPSYADSCYVMTCPVHGTLEHAVLAAAEDLFNWL